MGLSASDTSQSTRVISFVAVFTSVFVVASAELAPLAAAPPEPFPPQPASAPSDRTATIATASSIDTRVDLLPLVVRISIPLPFLFDSPLRTGPLPVGGSGKIERDTSRDCFIRGRRFAKITRL